MSAAPTDATTDDQGELTTPTDSTAVGGSPETTETTETTELTQRAACRRIAPVWPFESFVAVNPYLGLTDHRFDEAAERLALVAGARATMPASYYLAAVDSGRISPEDLKKALASSRGESAAAVDEFLRLVRTDSPEPDRSADRVPTVAEVATGATGHDWVRLATDRISNWAAAYFDEGQALWRSTDRQQPLFEAWREEATIDRTPEVMGLAGFRKVVASLPAEPRAAADEAILRLGIPADALELYLHALLLRTGGWSAYAARVVWDANLYDQEDDTLLDFLSVLLVWEVAIFETLSHRGMTEAWEDATRQLAELNGRSSVRTSLAHLIVLQEAFDLSEQRRLVAQFAARPTPTTTEPERPLAQAVFCIDVRSEVFRRHLEATGAGIDTIGFAGFFGVAIEYVPIAHETGEAQCPVLLTPGYTVAESLPDPRSLHDAVEARRLAHHVRRAWKSFKMGAISCFSFVGPVGLIYLPKLFTDSRGSTRPVKRPGDEALKSWAVDHKGPSLDPSSTNPASGITLEQRIELAQGALGGMFLTSGFGRLVMITGHGASTVNNPYDTGLDCGACGGHTGEANSRVAVAILNDGDVRRELAVRGISIPDDTWFVAAQHNTTTDEITVFDRALVPSTHADELGELDRRLADAGRATRVERARRLGIGDPGRIDAEIVRRSTDWAQVRPEWALAGCRTFVVAGRHRTRDLDLEGRSFLHSYDWRHDGGFGVLNLVMTAPMVVASWISLQYYASTVENRLFGSGNKTLHNVVGRVGVLEGNGGDLRTGLPWQSVHDGEHLQHEPLRLNVVIEAPLEAMNDVLAANPSVQDLCDNGWVHLLAMDDDGLISHRYVGGRQWEPTSA